MRFEVDEGGRILPYKLKEPEKSRKCYRIPENGAEIVFFGGDKRGFFRSATDNIVEYVNNMYLEFGCAPPGRWSPLKITELYTHNKGTRCVDWSFKKNKRDNMFYAAKNVSSKQGEVSLIDKIMYVKKKDLLIYKRYKKVGSNRRKLIRSETGINAVPHIQRISADFVKGELDR